MPELARQLAPRYTLEARIGEGACAVVYRARHAALDRPLAVKVLRAEILDNPALLERFRREGQSVSRIHSPHVVSILDGGRLPSGAAYIVMELLEGHTLSDELEAKLRLPVRRAAHIARQLCAALSAAHRIGVVHRDLKPENVFLTTNEGDPDFVKVVDFGIAKIADAAELTAAGGLLGTAEYMAPEQAVGQQVDARSDVYSFGVVLYEMLTGRVPFGYSSMDKLLAAHVNETPASPRTYRPDVSPALAEIVLRCLAKRPADRYPSMEVVGEALDSTMADTKDEVATVPPPAMLASRKPRRRFPFVLILLLAIPVGLALGIGIRAIARMPPFAYPDSTQPRQEAARQRRIEVRHETNVSAVRGDGADPGEHR